MSTDNDGKARSEVAKPHAPKPEERAALASFTTRKGRRAPAPKLSFAAKGNQVKFTHDHADEYTGWMLLANTLGTADFDFTEGLLMQLVNAGSQGGTPDPIGMRFMLSVVQGIAPKDEMEAMMAAQMAAVHMATMTFARRLAHTENIPQQDSASNAFNKLARTFAAQMEALKRHLTGGEQKVTVQHVTVNEGGQAVVGSVSTAPGGGGGFGKPGPTP